MEYYLKLYIKDHFNKTASDGLSVDELLAFIVNLSFSQGFEEGYNEGIESQKNT